MAEVKKVLAAPFELCDSGSFHAGYVTGLACGGWGSWEGICVEEWCCSGYTLTTRYRHKQIHGDWCLLLKYLWHCFFILGLLCFTALKETHIYTWHATCCCSWKLNKNPASSLLLLSPLFLLHISSHTQKCKCIDGHPTWAFSPSTYLTAQLTQLLATNASSAAQHMQAQRSQESVPHL